MATVKIPIREGARQFTEQVELDQAMYDLAFRYNVRDGKWRLSIDFGGENLVNALPLVADEDVLRNLRHIEDLMPGTLIVRDLDGADADPDDTNFGERVVLLYQEAS